MNNLIEVAYVCNGTACKDGCSGCGFTTDICHAENFKYLGAGKYIERDRKSVIIFHVDSKVRHFNENGEEIE